MGDNIIAANTYLVFIMLQAPAHHQQGPHCCALHFINDKAESKKSGNFSHTTSLAGRKAV